jgi:hypothetical protein
VIGVSPRPEYPTFDSEVRKPGAAFLAICPSPSWKQYRNKHYWSRAAGHLHAAYAGICAYTAMYLPERGSIDHFLPKTLHPHLAYEWSNFRLASGRVNSSKGNLTGILDPFEVQENWFFMDIPACLLKPNPSLEAGLQGRIALTISLLRLNQDDVYVQERCNILMEYARGDISISFLGRRYPFLAKEVDRQELSQQQLRELFKIK